MPAWYNMPARYISIVNRVTCLDAVDDVRRRSTLFGDVFTALTKER